MTHSTGHTYMHPLFDITMCVCVHFMSSISSAYVCEELLYEFTSQERIRKRAKWSERRDRRGKGRSRQIEQPTNQWHKKRRNHLSERWRIKIQSNCKVEKSSRRRGEKILFHCSPAVTHILHAFLNRKAFRNRLWCVSLYVQNAIKVTFAPFIESNKDQANLPSKKASAKAEARAKRARKRKLSVLLDDQSKWYNWPRVTCHLKSVKKERVKEKKKRERKKEAEWKCAKWQK